MFSGCSTTTCLWDKLAAQLIRCALSSPPNRLTDARPSHCWDMNAGFCGGETVLWPAATCRLTPESAIFHSWSLVKEALKHVRHAVRNYLHKYLG